MKRLAILLLAAVVRAQEPAPPPLAIEIDLTAQKAWVLQDGQRVYETPISSGRAGHETPTGTFAVSEKDLDHRSSLYGRIVDGKGRTLIPDADSDTPVPAGGKFVQAPMRHFLRFDGAIGMHAGRLPGYPASHGCVRLPAGKAALFFNIAELGTPVRVFGRTPRSGRPSRPAAKSTPVATPTPAPKGWFPWLRRL
ncbi:MAG: L,D-transpeptidase [Chthoniobacteraceae bacterium]